MPVDVVDLLEVVDVEHEHGEWRARAARLLQRLKQSLVEDAVVEEAGERGGPGFAAAASWIVGGSRGIRAPTASAMRTGSASRLCSARTSWKTSARRR